MGKSNINKIDLNREYPCPCRRQGKLLPIILTEAMGCDSCQQIFVVTEDGQFIQEVSSTYPYKRLWFWTGKRWHSVSTSWRRTKTYLSFVIAVVLLLVIILLPLIVRSTSNLIAFLTIISVSIAILMGFMVWLVYRR